jgi:hypothetical protein
MNRLLLPFLLWGLVASGQASASFLGLSPDRVVDWSTAGRERAYPSGLREVDVRAHGLVGDGQTDNAPAFQALIDGCREGAVLVFPEGTFLFRSGIVIRGRSFDRPLVVRGSGAGRTFLAFEVTSAGRGGLITIEGARAGGAVAVVGVPRSGERSVQVASTKGFAPGDAVLLSQANDLSAMDTVLDNDGMPARQHEALATWAARSVGQTLQVASVDGDRLTFTRPLAIDYTWGDVQVQRVLACEAVGLEAFTLENRRDTDGVHSILVDHAANVWIDGIHSLKTVKMHVALFRSRAVEIRNSRFEDSFRFGGGGHGYGVVCSKYTTGCLIENNVFRRLRHAMMIKEGANGNVFGYNHAFDGLQDGSTAARDISVHGHYPFMNLFEGNRVEYIHSTDYWGPAGPGNTFFRNRVTRAAVHLEDRSPRQNVIGNDVVPIPARPDWLYRPASARVIDGVVVHAEVIDPLLLANRVGSSEPAAPVPDLPASLYRRSPPAFWPADLPWPAFGPGTPYGAGRLPVDGGPWGASRRADAPQ